MTEKEDSSVTLIDVNSSELLYWKLISSTMTLASTMVGLNSILVLCVCCPNECVMGGTKCVEMCHTTTFCGFRVTSLSLHVSTPFEAYTVSQA